MLQPESAVYQLEDVVATPPTTEQRLHNKDLGEAALHVATELDFITELDGAKQPPPTDEVSDETSLKAESRAYPEQIIPADVAVDGLDNFYMQMGRRKLLNAEQEVTLAKRIEAGKLAQAKLQKKPKMAKHKKAEAEKIIKDGNAAHNEFVEANIRLVVSIAKRVNRKVRLRHLKLEDLIQSGTLGLSHAVDLFDWRKGFKFSTYATWWINQSIGRAIYDEEYTIRIPIHHHEDLIKLRRAENDILAGRHDPAGEFDPQIRRKLKWDQSKLDRMRASRTLQPISLDVPITDDKERTVADLVPDPVSTAEMASVTDEIRSEDLKKWFEDAGLDDRQTKIITLRFGIDGAWPMTLEEIGPLFGVTRERIRQIEAKALDKLRSSRKTAHLRDYIR